MSKFQNLNRISALLQFNWTCHSEEWVGRTSAIFPFPNLQRQKPNLAPLQPSLLFSSHWYLTFKHSKHSINTPDSVDLAPVPDQSYCIKNGKMETWEAPQNSNTDIPSPAMSDLEDEPEAVDFCIVSSLLTSKVEDSVFVQSRFCNYLCKVYR